MIFHCPVCSTPAGELATSGMQTLFCASCRFKYQVTAGTLEKQGSRQVTLQRPSAQHPGSFVRDYEFRIRQPDELKVVTLRLSDRDDRFTHGENDDVAVVHAMRGDVAENPVAVINQTTGNVVVVGKPGQTTRMGSVRKLVALQGKMQEVGAELYETRLDRIRGALPLLDEQLSLDDQLLSAYRRSQLMLEIELDSYGAADAIPDTVWSELEARQAEIREIEARTSDLKLLLSANEEVERFVRNG